MRVGSRIHHSRPLPAFSPPAIAPPFRLRPVASTINSINSTSNKARLNKTVRTKPNMGRNKAGNSKRNTKSTGTSRHRQETPTTDADHESMMCHPVNSGDNPLKGLQLRMWDFAQCDPKRCTGARLERRGVFRGMPLKQPFKGIVLSPNGTVSISPADRPILQEMVRD